MRYFIVMWQSEKSSGTSTVITKRNKYVNCDSFVNEIQLSYEVIDVAITNIIELSKKDFNNWNS